MVMAWDYDVSALRGVLRRQHVLFVLLMRRRPPRSTRTDTRLSYTTPFLSAVGSARGLRAQAGADSALPAPLPPPPPDDDDELVGPLSADQAALRPRSAAAPKPKVLLIFCAAAPFAAAAMPPTLDPPVSRPSCAAVDAAAPIDVQIGRAHDWNPVTNAP